MKGISPVSVNHYTIEAMMRLANCLWFEMGEIGLHQPEACRGGWSLE
jgi:hypothetical protein